MATLRKYNLAGEDVGQIEICDSIALAEVNGQMIKDYITAIRANARQWSACTRTRSEVSHSNKKPHRQKGLGRARQGSLAAPQYKGGGVVHGPRPKFNQHVAINRQEKQAAIRALLGEKVRGNRVAVVEDIELEAPKTQTMARLLNALGLQGRRTLVLAAGSYIEIEGENGVREVSMPVAIHSHLVKSLRNLQRTEFRLVANASGYDLLKAGDIILTESALAELNRREEKRGRNR